ncbi:MAG TPA: hypothetical protein P5234_10130 [Thermoanaerobaculaceae bacterium]|nr:hypothetical protein [Thermoanaerobaculaceae bacterium]HRS16585.1 hypothetical protein [Thermoanaerobaculaceae bacterium]
MRRSVTWLEIVRGDYIFPWPVARSGYALVDGPPSKAFDAKASGWKDVDMEPPFLVARGSVFETYAPLAQDDLHRRFARLADAKDFAGAVSFFANRFGLLGAHDVLLDEPKGNDIEPLISSSCLVPAESLGRWRLEARKLHAVIAWWDAVREHTYERCSRFIRWTKREHKSVAVLWRQDDRFPCEILAQEGVGESPATRPDLLARWSKDQVRGTIEALRYAVYLKVNEQLRGHVSPVIMEGERTFLYPDSLLSALWTLLAFELAAVPSPERRCLDCGAPLEGGTRRRRYCNANCRKRHYDRFSRPRRQRSHAKDAPQER